ncbi:unnamed protein product [Allacma fusca]|uniref:Uncharacterized protein n=1 Tax=Allacma fusca TaxID=39272 RepID=A0A8J2KQE2_9HEXA|nr:unnamed protein product [Allacma fusca]
MSSLCGKNKFAVVLFGKETAVIPRLWLNSDRSACQWPDVIESALTKLLINPASVPKDTWKHHPIRVLGTYRTLKSAREAEEHALYTSAIESGPETDVPENKNRTRRKQIRRVEVVDDHESDIEESNEDSGTRKVPLNLPESGLFNEPTIESLPGSSGEYFSESVPAAPVENIFRESEVLLLDPSSVCLNNQLFQTIIQESPPVAPNAFSVQAHNQSDCQKNKPLFSGDCVEETCRNKVSQERLIIIVGQNQIVDVEEFDDLPIPCSTKQELENLEQRLANIEDRQKIERYLSSIGGLDLKKVVKGILTLFVLPESTNHSMMRLKTRLMA